MSGYSSGSPVPGEAEAGRSPWPDHIIPPEDVDDWLADSAVKAVTYHRTSVLSASDVIEHGVDLAKSRIGSFGQGFYTATESDEFYGPAEVAVAIRTTQPPIGLADDLGLYIDHLARELRPDQNRLTPQVAKAIRRELLRLGYDGIVAKDAGGDGIDYVIAIKDGTVRVVVGR